MKKIYCIAISFTLVSCISNIGNNGNDVMIIDHANVKQMREENSVVPDLVKDWRYIKLEYGDNSMISDIQSVKFDGDKIFVFSKPLIGGGKSEIMVFDTVGRYLNSIGRLGRGPGEYIAISSWNIDYNNKQVVIIDNGNRTTGFYTYQGEFIRAEENKEEFRGNQDIHFLSDGKILCKNAISHWSNDEYILYDYWMKSPKVLFSRDITFDGAANAMRNNVNILGDSVSFMRDFCDTVYLYYNGLISPVIYVEAQKTVPSDYVFDGREYLSLSKELISAGYRRRVNFFETKDYYIFDNLIWNKRQNKGLVSRASDIRGEMPCVPFMATHGDILIGILSPHSISRSFYEEEGIELSAKYDKLLEGLDNNDNPVIILYEMKSRSDLFD